MVGRGLAEKFWRGIDCDCRFDIAQRQREVACGHVHHASPAEHIGIFRIEQDGMIERRDGTLEIVQTA